MDRHRLWEIICGLGRRIGEYQVLLTPWPRGYFAWFWSRPPACTYS